MNYDAYAGRRILVTGGTGFIGRYLIDGLLQCGARVRVLTRSNQAVTAWLEQVEWCHGDLLEMSSLYRACDCIEQIFHVAGYAHAQGGNDAMETQRHWQINYQGVRNMLDAALAAGVQNVVFFSSVKAMADGIGECLDEQCELPPQTPYGQAKKAAEQLVTETGRRNGLHTVNLRPALVYGPGVGGNLARMIAAARRGLLPPLPQVSGRRSLVYVVDLVQAALLAGYLPAAAGKTYIVTDGRPYSGREIYQAIWHACGHRVPNWAVPYFLLRVLAKSGDTVGRLLDRRLAFDSDVLERLLGWSCFRCDKIQQELGYRPTRTLEQALPAIVQAQMGA